MNDIVHVHTGEVKVGHANEVLQSTPIGSCVVIMAFGALGPVGIMAHIMLPGSAPKAASMPTRYAINAIDKLAENMAPHAPLNETGVCLIGAANVLNKDDDTICDSNIGSITEYLNQRRIPVRAAVLGGNQRRIARLYAHQGRMTFTQAEAREKTLWQYSDKPIRDTAMERTSLYG